MADVEAPIGEQIRTARLKKRLSQRELGARLGVTANAVWRAESGRRSFRQPRLELAARVLETEFVVRPGDPAGGENGK